MFLKQYNYKPRQGSQSGNEQAAAAAAATAGTGATQATSAPADNNTAPTTGAQAGRRRVRYSSFKYPPVADTFLVIG